MRACPNCQAANEETDDFCGNCASYLGWSEPSAARTGEPPAAPPRPGSRGPAATSGPSGRGEGPEPDREDGAAPARADPTVLYERDGADGPAHPDVGDPVAPVQPAKPVARRPVVRAAPVTEAPGGPPCPSCGTPNPPERRFCRRCAARLTPSQQVAALPWWRTRWPFRRRVRGGSGRGLRRLLAVLVVVALAVGVFLLLPAGRALFEDTRDKLGKAAEVGPAAVTASAEAPGHPASQVADGLSNRYWGAPGLGDSVSFTFGAPFRLVALVVHTGPSAKPEEFRRQARPVRADLVVNSADGKVHTTALTFNDKPGPQTVRLGVSDAVKVTLVVRAAAGLEPGRHIALAEVEFFKRA
ncbi:zinc ribbon domain-containing protein [Streptomyces albireticuli]|uniref:zinc ribbon domain-containing protein n=1 Tax=Streptomyces albireticuli TaxID=1940 RepID=UPI003685173E